MAAGPCLRSLSLGLSSSGHSLMLLYVICPAILSSAERQNKDEKHK
jgi:hypothetical protein